MKAWESKRLQHLTCLKVLLDLGVQGEVSSRALSPARYKFLLLPLCLKGQMRGASFCWASPEGTVARNAFVFSVAELSQTVLAK